MTLDKNSTIYIPDATISTTLSLLQNKPHPQHWKISPSKDRGISCLSVVERNSPAAAPSLLNSRNIASH
jgi:hypothetical protein